MRPSSILFATTLVATAALAVACGNPPESNPTASSATAKGSAAAPAKRTLDKEMLAAFEPLPKESKNDKNPTSKEKVELGRLLYFENRLSKNHDVSCNSCHDLSKHGVDNKAVSEGHKKQTGTRNSPTVYNAALHFRQFWDVRAADVEQQATMPITNPVEMAMPDEKRVVETLSSMPEYVDAFKKAFPDDKEPITLVNVGKAIGAFERTLLVPSPKWDKFLAGDDKALSDAEKDGLAAYLETGCQTCHSGALLGGHMVQKLGLMKPWPNTKDQGQFEDTKKDEHKMMFKVPSLRDVDSTAPYYHDGSIKTLEEAVKLMAIHQNGKTLSDADVKAIVTFLKALTAEIPAELTKAPTLPKSTDKTPKPEAN
jgi:cytochrome c peroxidase